MTTPEEKLEPYVQPGQGFDERYRVERTIGFGAYCCVYEAFDEQRREIVALKVIPPLEDGTTETAAGRFERELKVIENLEHSGIVDLLDFGTNEAGIRYMVLEYVEGDTLEERLAEGPLAADEALAIAGQVAHALYVAHEAGVIHRDLKPDNIMLAPGAAGPRPKVLDFGMAKLFARIGDETVDELTAEGMAVGTPRYIAPEQARGSRHVGPWTDVYALGLVLYEMLVGEKAVKHDSIESAVSEHVDEEPLALPGLDDQEEPVARLVRAMVRKDFRSRPQSALDIVEQVDRLAEMRLVEVDVGRDDGIVGEPLGGGRPEARPARSDGGLSGTATAQAAAPETEAADTDEDFQLHWERYGEHPSDDPQPVRPKTPVRSTRGRVGEGPGVGFYIQLLLLPVVVLLSFIFVTARLATWTPVARTVMGLAPAVLGLGFGAYERLADRRAGMVPSALAFSAISVVVVHFFGLEMLATELWRQPAWFLRPVDHWPVLGQLADAIRWGARHYVALLSDLVG